jgi:galactose mutarotase-like enzyme
MADYAIVLPVLDAIQPYGMDASAMLTPKDKVWPLEEGRIPLSPAHYGLDTIVLDEMPCRRALLVDKAGRPRVTLDFPDFPYLGLWTPVMPFDTNYICIEPWTTLPDGTFVGRGLPDKAGIRILPAGGSESLTYTTTFD